MSGTKEKKALIRYLAAAVIILAGLIPLLQLFPNTRGNFYPRANPVSYIYTDSVETGSSSIVSDGRSEDSFSLTYLIRGDYVLPYGAFGFVVNESDLSPEYDAVSFTIEQNNIESFWILLTTSSPLFPGEDAYFQKELNADSTIGTFTVPLNDFQTSNWWLERSGHPNDGARFDRKRDTIKEIQILAVNFHPDGKTSTVQLRDLSFVYSRQKRSVYVLLSLILITAGLVIIFLPGIKTLFHKVFGKNVILPYTPIEIEDPDSFWNERIRPFIENNSCDPELNKKTVCEEFSMPERKLLQLIRRKTNRTFPAYVNQLRIDKARRLLKDTDLPVIEIAFATGYNSMSHFNAQFKKITKTTPRELRNEA